MITACLPFCLQAQGLHITPGLQVVVTGSPNLVLNNTSLINNGNFSAGNSTVVFTGNAATVNSFIGGDNPISFYNVIVSKSSYDVQLNNHANISGTITMNGGNLLLNNYNLDLGNSGAIVGETNEACISGIHGGSIKIKALLNAPHAINPGNIGVELTSGANLGLTTIIRGNVEQNTSGIEKGIQRYFDISPATNKDLHATLRIYYFDRELAGKDKNSLSIFSSTEGQGNWELAGKDQVDQSAGWVIKRNIGQFHRFTLAIPTFASSGAGEINSANIFPNPSHDMFTLALFSDTEKKEFINLYDLSGHLLERKEVYCKAGLNNISWNIANYAGGVYYLGFENTNLRKIKIVKQ